MGGRDYVLHGEWHYDTEAGRYHRYDARGQLVAEAYRSAHNERGEGWHRRPYMHVYTPNTLVS